MMVPKSTALALLGTLFFLPPLKAGKLTREHQYKSIEGFVETMEGLRPANSTGEIAELFAIHDPGESSAPGTVVIAERVESCKLLWKGETTALLFATSSPPTEATASAVGVLFLLRRFQERWEIADLLRFTATGKYAGIQAEQTAEVGTGNHMNDENGPFPVVTITESEGGRGYSSRASASYTLSDTKTKTLKRLDLR